MSASISHLTELPIEILEQILLYLPGQDIIKMDTISRQFQNLARSSPKLQSRRELFATGLIDNPHNPCDLDEQRKLCKEYVRKWSDPTNMTKTSREVRLDSPLSGRGGERALARNLLSISRPGGGIDFLHVPPTMSRKPTESWGIPRFPFRVLHYAAYPPENILVVVGKKDGSIRSHLSNLLDGSPHRVPHSNVITWALPPGAEEPFVQDLAVTSSRLMMYIFLRDKSRPVWRVVLWDWRSGDLVFDRSSADESGLIRWNSEVIFLDEFRIMVSYLKHSSDDPLTVFNTLLPQDHPRNMRQFRFPTKYLEGGASVSLDHDRSLGTVDRDGHLIIDPTQAILVIGLSADQEVFLILRMQSLIEHACSMSTDVQIPWDKWGRGSVVMDNPLGYEFSITVVHGPRMMVIRDAGDGPEDHCSIRMFDFSRRGSADLPLTHRNDGEAERRAIFEDGRSCVFEMDGRAMRGFGLLGDSIAFYIVTPSSHPYHALYVLNMM